MGRKRRRLARLSVGRLGYSLIALCVMVGLLLGCSGCSSVVSSGPPGPPVDVNLTLALAVTDADGTPLDALVTVTVYEGMGANPQVYQWHTSTSATQQTVGCVAGDPTEEFTWEFNGFWADFQTITVQDYEYWTVEIAVTKTGYRPQQWNCTVFYEWVRDSGCYGMWWILQMQEVTP